MSKQCGCAALLVLAALAGCQGKDAPRPTVTIDGSSTVYPITKAIAEQFQRGEPVEVAVAVPVGISGTGGGMRKFCAGAIDVADASRPINRDESAQCAENGIEYVEIRTPGPGTSPLPN
jgi:phosphate transport system substrate-binding protein